VFFINFELIVSELEVVRIILFFFLKKKEANRFIRKPKEMLDD